MDLMNRQNQSTRRTVFLLPLLLLILSGCSLFPGSNVYTVHTTSGDFTILLHEKQTPHHAERFDSFVRQGLYNGVLFHRVVPGFVIQTGDPSTAKAGTPRSRYGFGGTGTTIQAEIDPELKHLRGAVAMARGPGLHTADSQWYICLKDLPHLDGLFTVFGEVVDGMEAVDSIASVKTDLNEIPIEPVRIDSISVIRWREFRKSMHKDAQVPSTTDHEDR